MSLFNFNENNGEFGDQENEHIEQEEIECQCEECGIENTMRMVSYFTSEALETKTIEHLEQILYQFAEIAKIQGIKEYLFSTTELNMDTLLGLDAFTNSFFSKETGNFKQQGIDFKDSFYDDNGGYSHWKDRM